MPTLQPATNCFGSTLVLSRTARSRARSPAVPPNTCGRAVRQSSPARLRPADRWQRQRRTQTGQRKSPLRRCRERVVAKESRRCTACRPISTETPKSRRQAGSRRDTATAARTDAAGASLRPVCDRLLGVSHPDAWRAPRTHTGKPRIARPLSGMAGRHSHTTQGPPGRQRPAPLASDHAAALQVCHRFRRQPAKLAQKRLGMFAEQRRPLHRRRRSQKA